MKRLLVCGICIVFLVAARAVAVQPREREQPTGSTVPLTPYLGRLLTVSALVGKASRPFVLLLDTAGGHTLLTPAAARAAGCEPMGRTVGFRMSGERIAFPHCNPIPITIAGLRLPDRAVRVWDLMAVLPKGVPIVDGVLSLATLKDRLFVLSLAIRDLIRSQRGGRRNARGAECRDDAGSGAERDERQTNRSQY